MLTDHGYTRDVAPRRGAAVGSARVEDIAAEEADVARLQAHGHTMQRLTRLQAAWPRGRGGGVAVSRGAGR
eukprot:scaffold25420_cov58-Phaeocystis_antarctica.AAC.3